MGGDQGCCWVFWKSPPLKDLLLAVDETEVLQKLPADIPPVKEMPRSVSATSLSHRQSQENQLDLKSSEAKISTAAYVQCPNTRRLFSSSAFQLEMELNTL